MIAMLQVYMSSSENGLSEEHDSMVIVSDDEVAPIPEVLTSDTESDPEMMSDDDDDFQPFALPEFGDDVPIADGIPVEDLFDFPAPIHNHLISGHPDGEHIVAPILGVVPLVVIPTEDWPFDDLFGDDVNLFLDGPPADVQGDGEVDDDVAILDVPPPVIPVIELSSDSNLHSVSDSFEFVTSSALQAAALQIYATDSDDDTAMSAAPLSPARVPTPPHVLEPVPEPDPVPFGQPDIAPLIPDPIPAPLDLPLVDPYIPAPPPADVAPPTPFESDAHRIDLPIVFLQEIPAPRPGEGTSGQPPRFDLFASADFPLIPQTTPSTPFTSTPFDEPFRWFPPYTMLISDPYHPSHFFEILSRRVLELELSEGAKRSPCPCHSTFIPPHSSPSASIVPPLAAPAPIPGFDARFLTVKQHISFLLRLVYELEEVFAHVRSLLFFPPPPPPSAL
ncbi:hypothetical protein Hanom_Chr04g00367511 [Helianthus anomalus]